MPTILSGVHSARACRCL